MRPADQRRAARCGRSGRSSASASNRAPGGQAGQHVLGPGAPAHLLDVEAEHAEERHAEAGHPQHRPLRPPRPEAAEAHRRVELPAPAVGVVAGADAGDVEQPLVRAGAGSAGRGGGPARRACPACASAVAGGCAGGRASASSSVASMRRAVVVGDVGHRPLRRQAVEVDEVADPVGQGVGELHDEAAALRVADHRRRPRRSCGRARRGGRGCRPPTSTGRRGRCRRGPAGPRPRPASPPSTSSGRQQVPGGGEVEAAVHAEHGRARPASPHS